MKNVLLLNMPFVSVSRPAIGIGILKKYLSGRGIACAVAYPNLALAQRIGWDAYRLIDETIGMKMFIGDWMFARQLFGKRPGDTAYLHTLRHILDDPRQYDAIMRAAETVGPFLQTLMRQLDIERYGIIGFTTTFQQNLASLALARMIKNDYPGKTIIFGGANCEGIMGLELHRSFPWLDYVCRGEADTSFPFLVEAILDGGPVEHIAGIVYRKNGRSVATGPAPLVEDMDRVPIPDYDDYFAALHDSPLAGRFVPAIPIQNARGCWWGENSHCKFCGLNGDTLRFRSKSPSRISAELRFQEQRYKITRFEAVDNIMDMTYFDTLLPLLKKENRDYSFFYEVKSNLSREHVKLLSEAGVRAIQPGIESLHTHVLALMKKGVKAYQNIQLLKWCRQYGIDAEWNLLYGFPGETLEDYGQTERFIDSIFHLQPPCTCGEVRLDRFSPYFSAPGHYGLTDIRPFSIYRYIYPLSDRKIANLVYFFQFESAAPRPSSLAAGRLKKKVDEWKRSANGQLIAVHGDNPGLMLNDTRVNRRHACAALNGAQQEVYDYCDTGKRFSRIKEFVNARYGSHLADGPWLRRFLEQMVEWRYMIADDDIYLSLAVETEGFYASGGQAPF